MVASYDMMTTFTKIRGLIHILLAGGLGSRLCLKHTFGVQEFHRKNNMTPRHRVTVARRLEIK